jgi:hypothetical protein
MHLQVCVCVCERRTVGSRLVEKKLFGMNGRLKNGLNENERVTEEERGAYVHL